MKTIRPTPLLFTTLLLAACGGGGGSSSPSPPAPSPPPAPTIATLTPNAAMVGGSNFVLTVTGTGFVAGSEIRWNGSTRATTFVNNANLQAPIAASDIGSAGQASITVVNPAANGGTSSAATFTVNNPAPTISALSHTFVAPGGAAFALTVNGTGYVPGSLVRWNGSDRTTTFASATQLTAAIPASDIATQGSAQVTVFNASPGGGLSAALPVAIGNPLPQITRLVPAVVRPGSAAFNLQLDGTAFVTGATVTWNGVNSPTTFVSATELQVPVSAPDVATAGTVQVVSTNPGPGGGASNTAAFTIAPFGVIERLSVAPDGSDANGSSDNPSMDADGRYIAFMSEASNLVAGDVNGIQDIFVRDTCLGVASGCTPSTQRVSVATGGNAADGASSRPSISADGRYVAFESTATNLVTGDTNGVTDVFVRDTCVGAASACTPSTSRVSIASDGSQGSSLSSSPSISNDGRFVSFITPGILVLGDINNVPDAFVRDTCAGAAGCQPSTARISAANDTLPDYRGVESGTSMSANGRFVAYQSFERCLGCNVRLSVIHVFDSCAGAPSGCTQSSVRAATWSSSSGQLALGDRSLSANGRYVTYSVDEAALDLRAMLADSCISAPAGCTISTTPIGAAGSNSTAGMTPTLTPNGRFVSSGENPTLPLAHVFVHDSCIDAPAGCVLKDVRISESDAGSAANGSSFNSMTNAAGSRAVFSSDATNLLTGDGNARRDIFVARTGLSF